MAQDDLAGVVKRLETIERVLGLQKLSGAADEEAQLAGLSTQSNHCGGSALSVVCAAPEMRAMQ